MISTQIKTQEAAYPNRQDPGVLEHLQELLIGAETAYADNYNTLEVVSAKEEQAYVDFETSANDSLSCWNRTVPFSYTTLCILK